MANIEYRTLGDSGLIVSTIGLGCNNFGRAGTATETQEGTDTLIDAAIDAGVTFFDTADIYGKERGLSETLMGASLQGKRDRIVLATKFGHDMAGINGPDWGVRGSRRYIRLAVESSLRRLRTDWIDLYQLHHPDPVTPIEETLETLETSSPRARSATSATPTSPAGRSRRPSSPRGSPGIPGSSPRRTSTACWSAEPSARCCRRSTPTASASCRSSRSTTGSSPASSAARAVPPTAAS